MRTKQGAGQEGELANRDNKRGGVYTTMTAEHMASRQNKRPCAPGQQNLGRSHRDRDSTPSPKERHQAIQGGGLYLVSGGSPRSATDPEYPEPETNSSPPDRDPPSPPGIGNPCHDDEHLVISQQNRQENHPLDEEEGGEGGGQGMKCWH